MKQQLGDFDKTGMYLKGLGTPELAVTINLIVTHHELQTIL